MHKVVNNENTNFNSFNTDLSILVFAISGCTNSAPAQPAQAPQVSPVSPANTNAQSPAGTNTGANPPQTSASTQANIAPSSAAAASNESL